MFITGCTESCQNDNFESSQWLKFCPSDNISIAVLLMHCRYLTITQSHWYDSSSPQRVEKNEKCYTQSCPFHSFSGHCQRCRADTRFAPSQWETALLCNDVSHWLGANLESALCWLSCLGTSRKWTSNQMPVTSKNGNLPNHDSSPRTLCKHVSHWLHKITFAVLNLLQEFWNFNHFP